MAAPGAAVAVWGRGDPHGELMDKPAFDTAGEPTPVRGEELKGRGEGIAMPPAPRWGMAMNCARSGRGGSPTPRRPDIEAYSLAPLDVLKVHVRCPAGIRTFQGAAFAASGLTLLSVIDDAVPV